MRPKYGHTACFVGGSAAPGGLVYPNAAPLGRGANSFGNYIIFAQFIRVIPRYADSGTYVFFGRAS